MADKKYKLSVLSQLANENTNLHNAPMRYMDHSSFLAGTPLEYGQKYRSRDHNYDASEYDAWGLVDTTRPKEVYLAEQDFSKFENMKVLPHEGTHSKQAIARNRRALPELSHNLKENIRYLMETNPKFLREYFGHASDKRKFGDINNLDELLSGNEMGARLQAMEAMMPKGQMLEHSEYANDLFSSDEEINAYLSAMVPEGHIRNNSADSFRPIPNQTLANPDDPDKGILDLIRKMLTK